jgi:hypothetical protein
VIKTTGLGSICKKQDIAMGEGAFKGKSRRHRFLDKRKWNSLLLWKRMWAKGLKAAGRR